MQSKERISWNDELIAEEVMKIATLFDPPRMPSNQEVVANCGNYSLAVAIQKHGGYEWWANKLGLKRKYSETKTGVEGERRIAELLRGMGFKVETTSARFPYDLLVDGCVKVDVKTANTSFVRGCPIHAYRLAKRQQTCDFYIFYEADTEKAYVVPSCRCHGQVQVGMGNTSSPYERYLYAYDLIAEANDMYKAM